MTNPNPRLQRAASESGGLGFIDLIAEAVEGLKGDDLAAYNDLEWYSRYVVGYDNPEYASNSTFLKKIYEELQHNEADVLILGPRGSAKSTAVSVTYVTWAIGRDPMIRFLLGVNAVESQGLAFGRQIDTILRSNQRYISIFGSLVPTESRSGARKWSEYEKIVVRPEPPGGVKDPTLAIVGEGSRVPSKRADILILDDMVTMNNTYSPVLRAKLERFVFQTLFPVLRPGGRKIVVGSRWDVKDLYATLADRWGLAFPQVEAI